MKPIRFATIAGFAFAVTLPHAASATNGYFSVGYDAESTGQVGIGVSSGSGVEAAAANPALGVKAGNSAGGGFSLFSPHRDVTNTSGAWAAFGADLAPGKFESGQDLFLIPYLGANFQVDDQSAFSLLLYANGGMNTHYNDSPFKGFGAPGFTPSTPAGVDFNQVFLTPNYARSIGHGVSLGGGPVFAAQRVNIQGLQAFDSAAQSSSPGHVTNNGYDYAYGVGAKIGVTWDAAEWLTFGVAYQTRTWMTKFERYKGLFADGGGFDIPPSVTSGVTIRPIGGLDLSFEHERIFYGDISSIANEGSSTAKLGTANGAGFGWRSMNVYRVGAQWRVVDDLTVRTGFSHATDFTTGSNLTFNIIAPATIKDHVSAGLSYDITPHWGLSFAYLHAFSKTFTGSAQNDPTQTISLRMDQDEGTLGLTYRW